MNSNDTEGGIKSDMEAEGDTEGGNDEVSFEQEESVFSQGLRRAKRQVIHACVSLITHLNTHTLTD